MAKTPSENLFLLIKKMSGAEKRYFKLHISTHQKAESRSVTLFDAIVQSAEYDEVALKQIVYGEAVSSTKFTELKSFLYQEILTSLTIFDALMSVEFKLKNALLHVRVLYKRGLYSACKGELSKIKKTALRFEEFTILIEILRWEKQIAYAESNINYLAFEMQRIENEEETYLKKLENYIIFKNTFYKVLANVRQQEVQTHNTSILQDLENLIADPLFASPENALSHLAQVTYFRFMSLISFARLDNERFYLYSKDLLQLMESQPHFIAEDATEYISALSNFMKSCFAYEQYDDALVYINKFQTIDAKTSDDRVKIQRQYYQSRFQLCVTTGQFEQGVIEVKNNLNSIQQFDSQLFSRSTFHFAYFYIYFGNGEYETALDYLNQWLMANKSVERQDLQVLSHLLNIMVHYELGHTQLLESLMRSTYRVFRKNKQPFTIERKLLTFIKATQQVRTRKELLKLFEDLKADFETLAREPKEAVIFLYFDFIAWLEAKTSNRTFAQVVQLRFEQKYKPLSATT